MITIIITTKSGEVSKGCLLVWKVFLSRDFALGSAGINYI